MQVQPDKTVVNPNLERIANVLRYAGWGVLWVQLALAGAAGLCIVLAISGRSIAEGNNTPGIGIGIFWAGCSILAVLGGIYLAFRWTRFARRLRHLDPTVHPAKADVLKVLRWSIILGFVGMLLAILGEGATLGVLLAKSISQPQGVAIYNPERIIRSLDIFVAMANINGIAAHFIGAAASLSLLNWLHK